LRGEAGKVGDGEKRRNLRRDEEVSVGREWEE
jgi:hypothetical protein